MLIFNIVKLFLLEAVNLILCIENRWLLGLVSQKSKWWIVYISGECLLCWSFPKAAMVDRAIPDRAA